VHSDFIVPKIQPDELLAGYRGRIAAWNGCDSSRAVAHGMAEQYPLAVRWTCQTTQFIEAAAQANHMQFMELIREHTTYILRAESGRWNLQSFDQARVVSTQASMALYSHNKRIWGCAACMQEDLKQLCFSYWRRDHQVPGRVLCPKHTSPLVAIRETQLLPGGPAQSESFIGSVQRSENDIPAGAHRGEFTVAVLDRMISTFRRPPHNLAVRAIRQGLEAQGFDPSDPLKRKQLQAAITKQFNPLWLEGVAGKVGARPETIGRKVKRVLNPRLSCPAIDVAIVASLAFTEVEEALVALGLQSGRQECHPDCSLLTT
jgi:hypothetical protein